MQLSARKEVFRLEEFLICENPSCRLLISLREGDKLLPRSELLLKVCPECDHEWSGHCPFCAQLLDIFWGGGVPFCSLCSRPLQADAHVDWSDNGNVF
jgi:hypothetical protein